MVEENNQVGNITCIESLSFSREVPIVSDVDVLSGNVTPDTLGGRI